MIKIIAKHKKKNENQVYLNMKTNKINKAELMVVIGALSEIAMKEYDVSKMEMLDFIKKRG